MISSAHRNFENVFAVLKRQGETSGKADEIEQPIRFTVGGVYCGSGEGSHYVSARCVVNKKMLQRKITKEKGEHVSHLITGALPDVFKKLAAEKVCNPTKNDVYQFVGTMDRYQALYPSIERSFDDNGLARYSNVHHVFDDKPVQFQGEKAFRKTLSLFKREKSRAILRCHLKNTPFPYKRVLSLSDGSVVIANAQSSALVFEKNIKQLGLNDIAISAGDLDTPSEWQRVRQKVKGSIVQYFEINNQHRLSEQLPLGKKFDLVVLVAGLCHCAEASDFACAGIDLYQPGKISGFMMSVADILDETTPHSKACLESGEPYLSSRFEEEVSLFNDKGSRFAASIIRDVAGGFVGIEIAPRASSGFL